MSLIRIFILLLFVSQTINAQKLIGKIPIVDLVDYETAFIDSDNFLFAWNNTRDISSIRKFIHYQYDGEEWAEVANLDNFYIDSIRNITNVVVSDNAEFIGYELSALDFAEPVLQSVVVQKKSEITGEYQAVFRIDSLGHNRITSYNGAVDIDLSSDGRRLVISHISELVTQQSGIQRLAFYTYSESLNTYHLQQEYFTPHAYGVGRETSVAISGDGNTVALGFNHPLLQFDSITPYSGLIFDYNDFAESWIENAFKLDSDPNNMFGEVRETLLSHDGGTAIFSSQSYNDELRQNALCFQKVNEKWEENTERFLSYNAELPPIREGQISISAQGDMLAIVHLQDSVFGGHVDLYKHKDKWEKIKEFTYPKANGFNVGFGCELTPMGDRILLEDAERNLRIYDLTELMSSSTDIVNPTVFNIFPNPSDGFFHIKGNGAVEKIDIYNYNGQLIKCIAPNNFNSFSLGEYPPGLYLVKIFSGKDYNIIPVTKH